ncbi:MAG: response regulator [Candidatus Kapaibacteriota bacterium]|jgi:DNA-binding NarL/FixJ family response regulator
MPIRVFIADDQRIFVDGLRTILEQRKNEFTVAGYVSDARNIIEEVLRVKPDVILMDIDMPHQNGITTLNLLQKHASPEWKPSVIMLSLHEDRRHIGDAIHNETKGYMVKGAVGEKEVLDAIRAVAAGGKYFCPLSQAVLTAILTEPQAQNNQLTPRQVNIIRLVAQGKTTPEIAKELYITESTVSQHRLAAMQRLNIKNTAELVRYVVEAGW